MLSADGIFIGSCRETAQYADTRSCYILRGSGVGGTVLALWSLAAAAVCTHMPDGGSDDRFLLFPARLYWLNPCIAGPHHVALSHLSVAEQPEHPG